MNRIALCVAAACAASAIGMGPPGDRHILLEGDTPDGVRRFVTRLPQALSLDGDKPQAWVTITKAGSFSDQWYGDFEITRAMLSEMVKNFNDRTYGQDIFLDVSHRPSDGAAGKFLKLAVEGSKLRGLVEFTPYGVDAHRNKGFCYLSAEYHENWKDNEKGDKHGCLLMGAGLTIRPCLKGLEPFQLAAPDGERPHVPTLLHPDLPLILLSEVKAMWKNLIARLVKTLSETHKLAAADVKVLSDQAEAALAKITDKSVAEVLIGAMESAGKQLAEARAAGSAGVIQLSVAPQLGGLTEAQVKKLMEDTRTAQEASARQLAETQTARRTLLAATINAATGIPDEDKKELIDSVQDLVTADTSEDHVNRLAATQIAAGNRLVAARSLSSVGYHLPQGSVVISIDASNDIEALQAEVDKRLGFADMPAHQRYSLSEGVQVAANKGIVEKALAMYDATHGRRLVAEYKSMKKLAAGDSLVSDVAVPASFERTVIREALYQMVGLGLCDVGTADYAAVVQLPYSYRDTTGAGVAAVRKYEGQAISRSAVKQALEEARPIPQKIAFEVSDELRYLVGNGQINFDIVADNARNAIRIVGEDTEQLIFNEHLNASDEQATVNRVNEAVANGDAVKTIFVLDNFPVVRPKKVYDLQGNQVGATLYPVTVTVAAVAIAEYTGGQGAGTYYKLNANLGELEFVNQAGAPTAPANLAAIVASYTYTTNVHKWDSDLGALKVDEKYDDFLYRFGLRKSVVEDRAYMANLAIMSGTLRTQIEQARQFGANFKRAGTDLMADGNLGRIKDVPAFRSYAPGLNMGDVRTVICERGTTRFRMLKPWTMGQLENQKDANGRFTGKKEAYGDQFIVVHTPSELRKAFTSMVVYSAAARVDR